jgi:hypothetical protein
MSSSVVYENLVIITDSVNFTFTTLYQHYRRYLSHPLPIQSISHIWRPDRIVALHEAARSQ